MAQVKPVLDLDSKVHYQVDIYVSNNSNEREQFAKKNTLDAMSSKYVLAIEVMIVLILLNDFSGHNLHFSEYNGQTETC